MANKELLNRVLEDIKEDKFRWDQGVWASSHPIPDGLSPNDFDNVCETSFCFAGRVASLLHGALYAFRDDRYFLSSMVQALPYPYDQNAMHSHEGYFVTELVDGVVTFKPYEGMVMSSEVAAIRDLGLSYGEADALFHSANDLEDLTNIVDDLVNGTNNHLTPDSNFDYTEHCGCGCDD